MRKIAAVVAALTVAMLVGAGIAYASVPGPGGVINGCRKNTDGSMRVIDSTASCPSGWTALNWRQVDPVTITFTAPSLLFEAGGFNGTAVACPAGRYATGGGGGVNSPGLDVLELVATWPLDDSSHPIGWQAIWRNTGTDPINASISVYVICTGS